MPRRRPAHSERTAVPSVLPRALASGRPGLQLVTLIMVVLSIWLLTSFIGQVMTSNQMDRRKAELQSEIAVIEAQNQRLSREIEYVESVGYTDKIAREQLGLSRSGDTVVLPNFPQPLATLPEPTPEPLPALPQDPNWQLWVQAFRP